MPRPVHALALGTAIQRHLAAAAYPQDAFTRLRKFACVAREGECLRRKPADRAAVEKHHKNLSAGRQYDGGRRGGGARVDDPLKAAPGRATGGSRPQGATRAEGDAHNIVRPAVWHPRQLLHEVHDAGDQVGPRDVVRDTDIPLDHVGQKHMGNEDARGFLCAELIRALCAHSSDVLGRDAAKDRHHAVGRLGQRPHVQRHAC